MTPVCMSQVFDPEAQFGYNDWQMAFCLNTSGGTHCKTAETSQVNPMAI